MKAIVLKVDDEVLARRRLTGVDRYDEMWEGVLHMGSSPRSTKPENPHPRSVFDVRFRSDVGSTDPLLREQLEALRGIFAAAAPVTK